MPSEKTPVGLEPVGASRSAPLRPAPAVGPSPTGTGLDRVVVVGTASDVPRALSHPAVLARRLNVAAVVAVDIESDDQTSARGLIADALKTHTPRTILVAGPLGNTTMRTVADLALLYHCNLLAVMPAEVLAGHDPVVVWSGDYPLVQLASPRRTRFSARIKRGIDIVASAAGLVVAAPIVTVLAGLIMLESPGQPFFEHERIGLGGRRFRCFKLRTMRTGAERQLAEDAELYELYRKNHFKIPDRADPRVTPLGTILRRTSLDELPQLWNVFVGDMSLVGPRPVVKDELALYEPGERDVLLSVRPGITGAWAVSGRHGVGYPERCEMELGYVRSWTLLTDVRILFATVGAVLRPGGED
jgi:lipopolysaccharide/colanic/teichoic acid biosynthesis glycosyltransferase